MLEREGVEVGRDGRVAGFADGSARFRFGAGGRGGRDRQGGGPCGAGAA